MSTPAEKANARRFLLEFSENGNIPNGQLEQAIDQANIHPGKTAWFEFLDKLLLILGSLALSVSLLFFIAYNWQELGRFAKFAMVETAILLATMVYVTRTVKDLAAKMALLCAAISLGVLMALYGQTYQTGADPWQLFFNWALLITPWVLVGRFSILWVLWVGLLNLSLVLYHQTFGSLFWSMLHGQELLWVLFLFNLLVWGVWEIAAKIFSWLRDDWSLRVIATATGFCITWLAIDAIVRPWGLEGFWVWLLWYVAVVYGYQFIKRDLFILAGSCLSVISVVLTFMVDNMLDFDNAGSFLLLSFSVIGMGAGAAYWLRSLHTRWLHEE